ncbi:lamin tail domain-containing protein [Reichenbachiella carrageenanivorans]|uniref:Lamin tail domain-containing protein n=1 Tax=Reichenbachiella carrageenanivorans TaxID=2979869 RepID=A0ABY6D439_9BACT|nr:lamin tail domain-containing protein [Reichenbachiella carrageenanivorans]UXX80679.1 lamin tail domain-containing protein [Reichenbachiella carrageenanivorans]
MRYLFALITLFLFQVATAQVSDDFTDGDFTANPAWTGDIADFNASSFQLRLDAAAAGSSYLSTSQTELGETTWEFLVDFAFNVTTSNHAFFYLVSDQSDLSGSLNGYYVSLGSTGDKISLNKQTGNTKSVIIDGSAALAGDPVQIRVRITRDASANWSLYSDTSGGSSFTLEGAIADNDHTATSHTGIRCVYTDTRKDKIYFDDISISTAAAGFGISSLTKEGTNGIRLKFNQNVDETTAQTLSNYTLDYDFGNPQSAQRDATHLDEVLLTFADGFVNNNYTLHIDQVKNEAQDETIDDEERTLNVPLQTPFRTIVINEIMADPNPTVVLPDAEYLELYNTTGQAINIGNFEIDGRTLGDFTLGAYEYVTLTASANAGDFSGNVLGLSGLSLSNSGESLELTDNLGNLVDSVSYTDSWYQDSDKSSGGYSLEQINPMLACSYQSNWIVSSSVDGGTPGTQNAVYDNSPDLTAPNLIDFIATDANTFKLTFDEPMDETSLTNGTYSFDNGLSENGISPIGPGFLSTTVGVTPALANGVIYTVTATGVTDCAGNAIHANSLSFAYDTNPPVLDRILVKTANTIEVIFNEDLNESTAETESNYSSDHGGPHPTQAIRNDTDPSIVSLTFADDFVLNVENTLTISLLEDLQGNALATPIMAPFTLSQQIDTVHVMGINLLDIYFKQNLEPISASTAANYFVNDGVDHPVTAFLDGSNSRLVHLAFANNFDDNQELILSVANVQNTTLDFLTTPDITFEYDTSPPKLDVLTVTSASSLEIIFTEKVGKQSAESKENYEYEDIFPSKATLAADQKTVTLQFAQDFEREVEFDLYIDEVKDLYANEIRTRIRETFVYDIFAPELDSVIVQSADRIILWFNESVDQTSAENAANYTVNGALPTSATLNLEYPHLVYLHLSSSLPEVANIPLRISNISDVRSNTLSSAIDTNFDYNVFYVSTINPLSAQSLQIEFNKTPNVTSKDVLANYTLNGKPASSITFSTPRVTTVTFDIGFEDETTYTLKVVNVNDVNLNALSVTDYSFDFDSRVSVGSVVGDRSVAIAFDVALDQGQTLLLSNFSSNPSLGNCLAAVVDADDPETLRLTFEQALAADVAHTISWKDLSNVFGHRLPDYFTTVTNDQTAPAVSDYLIVNTNSIWLQYSEPLNENSAEFLSNYRVIPNIGEPIDAKYTLADSSVLLAFNSEFQEGEDYNLSLENIEDLSDNALTSHIIPFTFTAPNVPDFGDLIITEIMADPTPEVGLTDAEYLEIFNTTDQSISLIGLSLVDEGGSTTLLSGEVPSGGYMVLTSTSNASDFPGVSVMGVTSFPSFNNTGETISIYADSKQIFSTSYNTSWYKDSEKEDGGWSLEMIDTSNPCGEKSNWIASSNIKGGTPGLANSVQASNPDNFGPQLLSALAADAQTLELTLNEKLNPASFAHTSLTIAPARTIADLTLLDPQNAQIEVKLAEALSGGESYKVTLSNVADCNLNIIQSDHNTASLRLPEAAEANDIVINEVLFNPRSGGVDFVEIYNNSDKAINLKNWGLGDKTSDLKLISTDHLVINPAEYLALTPEPDILIIEYPKGDAERMIAMGSFPNFADTGDSVILVNDDLLIIDQMEYQDDYHFNLLDDDEGVSLERVSFEAESFNPDSWKSAASTAGYATPGVVNSQFQAHIQSSATVSIDPKVFVPDNTGMNDYTTISYQLDQSGYFANVHIYSTAGYIVKTLAEGELLSISGFYTWDGTTDNGRLATVGYYLVVFETFDGDGNKSIQKETVVLGARF